MSAGSFPAPALMDPVNPEMMARFGEKFLLVDTVVSPEEYHELKVLEQFLDRHVRPVGIRDVQCMLLWSEWVRTFRRRTPGFPKLVRENEFRSVITDKFGIEIIHDNIRGPVYPGIRFVP
jgi:hypothetical protein